MGTHSVSWLFLSNPIFANLGDAWVSGVIIVSKVCRINDCAHTFTVDDILST